MRKLHPIAVLLSLAACQAPPPVPEAGDPTAETASEAAWFTEITAGSGLDFRHAAGHRGDYQIPEITGSGGALFDYDGDGDLDVYLVDGGAPGDGGARNRMWRQESDGRFREVTDESGLGDPGYGMGCALGDVDNDGDPDLLVTNLGPDALYLNRGGGVFAPAPESPGIGDDLWSSSACFLDYDGDGLLDLYLATYVEFDPAKRCRDNAGNWDYCGPNAFRGVPDRLYRGRGDGTFTDVSAAALGRRPANKGLGVVCADLDRDARVDVYVANDGEQNQLWLNRGPGSDGLVVFEDQALVLGAALDLFSRPEASMGIAVGDVDGDLDLDLLMTHLDRETNTLYLNLGELGFEDRTPASGLGPPALPRTGFGAAFFDADLDGDLDLAVANGRVSRGSSPAELRERLRSWRVPDEVPPLLREYAEPNLFFLGRGDGSFEDASARAGRFTGPAELSRGLMTGDVDRDGDLDLLVTAAGGRARLYRNDLPRRGRWLLLRAIDPGLGRDALGATIEVRAGGREIARPVISAFSYLSAVEPEVHFGLGPAERVDAIAVVWPDGSREEFAGGAVDRRRTLRRGEGTIR